MPYSLSFYVSFKYLHSYGRPLKTFITTLAIATNSGCTQLHIK